MNKILSLTLAAATAAVTLTSCGKLGELSADNFRVTPTPLETNAGLVTATINGTFPEKYMKKNAVVTVTPVLKYNGRETSSESATFQGEKVRGNGTEISYKLGGNYNMKATFSYVPDMIQSELYLRFNAMLGSKDVALPDVKVGYGVRATSQLLGGCMKGMSGAVAPDNFQRVIAEKRESQIKFLIGQAQLRQSELQSTSVKDFISMIKQINDDQERLAIDNIEVSSYASPDGSFFLNEELAAKRQDVTEGYLRDQLQKIGAQAYDIDAKYTAEDWDGFQELVAASNIQDKEIILSVLKMYYDPEEREQQIHNLSSVYSELADGVLPELRRSRLTINYQVIGRDDEQIMQQFKDDAKELSVEELVYAANYLATDAATQEAIMKKTIELYPADYRSYNNLAALYFSQGNTKAATNYLTQAKAKNANAPEIAVNEALMAIREGEIDKAATLLGKGTEADAYNEVLGCLEIAKGNYPKAAKALEGKNNNCAALANILCKDYSAAAKILASIKDGNAYTSYLSAVLSARQKDTSGVVSNLRATAQKDSKLAQRALKDLEFAKFTNAIKSIF